MEYSRHEHDVLIIGSGGAGLRARVLMRFVQEQPYSAVAQALNCSEATARTHIARGRSRLRRLLAHRPAHQPQEAN